MVCNNRVEKIYHRTWGVFAAYCLSASMYNRGEKIYLSLLARRAPVSEPINRFDDKFHLGARVHKK